MILEIVTPEATLLHTNVEIVTVPGINGEFQMLKDHAPIVTLLQEGKVKISGNISLEKEYASKFTKDAEGNTVLQISSGTIELKNNKVIVLAD